jgi:hypothetical protein
MWIYLLISNIGEEELPYQMKTKQIYGNTHLIYDYFNRQIVSEVRGTLKPAKASYYILAPAPEREGISFLGFEDKFITAPSSHIRGLQEKKGGIQLLLSAPPGSTYPLKVHYDGKLVVEAEGAKVLEVTSMSNLHTVWVKPKRKEFSVHLGG